MAEEDKFEEIELEEKTSSTSAIESGIENPVFDHAGTDDIELQLTSPTADSAQNNNTKPPPNASSGDNPASNGFVINVPTDNENSSPPNQVLIKGDRSGCYRLLTLHKKKLLALLALLLIIIIAIIVIALVLSLDEKKNGTILNKETAKLRSEHDNCDQHMDPYSEWQARLFDGSSQTHGDLHVFHREGCEHSWIKVCADDLTYYDKQIACKSRVKKAEDHTDTMDEKHTVKLKCHGEELSLSGCRKQLLDKSECTTSSIQLDCEDKVIDLSTASLYAINDDLSFGYLSLQFGGRNGLLCNDKWSLNNSIAVCRQLGYTSARNASNMIQGHIVPDIYATVPIYSAQIHCNHSETKFSRCHYNSAKPYQCSYRDAVSVFCLNETAQTTLQPDHATNQIDQETTTLNATERTTTEQLTTLPTTTLQPRVALSPNATATLLYSKDYLSTGILEITENDRKLLVCDDEWGINEGRVACRMAGFQGVKTADLHAFFDAPQDDSWVLPYLSSENAIKCNGNETHLSECLSVPVRSVCSHFDEVVLECLPETPLPTSTQPTTQQPATASTVETNVTTFSTTSTTEQETTTTAPRPEYEIRLLPAYTGSDPSKGRLEILIDGVWGTVCDDGWSETDAEVVCRELGYDAVDRYNVLMDTGQNGKRGKDPQPIHLKNVNCRGSESRLSQCNYDRDTSICNHRQDDLLMSCKNVIKTTPSPLTTPAPYQLRLNPEGHRGRLEVLSEEYWYTVCDDGWDEIDAVVACRQLGYSNVSVHKIEDYDWSEGTGYYLMTEVHCTGNETSLSNCDYQQGTGYTGCSVWLNTVPEIFLECNGLIEASNSTAAPETTTSILAAREIRLVSGSNSSNVGMLSIYSTHVDHSQGSRWGKVCDKNHWDLLDARVACRQLGFPGVLRHDLSITDLIGVSNAALRMPYNGNMFRCNGNEEKLMDCTHSKFGSCPENDEVVIECEPNNITTTIDDTIRLVNGENVYEGILEVKINSTWGRVCEVGGDWTIQDGELVCLKMFRKEHSYTYQELGHSFNVSTTAELSPYVGGRFRCDSINQPYNNCTYRNDDTYIQSCSNVILTCF